MSAANSTTWPNTTTARAALAPTMLRPPGSLPRTTATGMAWEPCGADEDPANLAAWAEFHAQVEHLPEEQREVFDLLWYQELSQAEAATLLGVSERTVKRRWACGPAATPQDPRRNAARLRRKPSHATDDQHRRRRHEPESQLLDLVVEWEELRGGRASCHAGGTLPRLSGTPGGIPAMRLGAGRHECRLAG